MGDPNFEPDLFTFISNAHDRGIKIGIVVSEKSFIQDHFLTPHYTWQNAPVRIDCYPDQARLMVNPKSDASLREHLKAEICKAALRTAAYNSQSIFAGGYADFVSLEYEYWTSAFYLDHPQYVDDNPLLSNPKTKEWYAYMDVLDILNFMRYVICSTRYSPLSSEMELRLKSYSPSLPAYTTIPDPQVQAIDIDQTSIDRILLVDYQYYASGFFGYSCDNLYWLGHPTTGRKTQIWSLLSAESTRYTKDCFFSTSTIRWDNFLGDYLEGIGPVYGGNPHTLNDAESVWLNDLQAATSTSCSNCSCNFTNGNNNITGFMWFVSSILVNNNFQREGRGFKKDSELKFIFINNDLIVNGANSTNNLKIIDGQGRVFIEKQITNSPISLIYLSPGLYIGYLTDQEGQILMTEKIIIIK